MKSKLFLFSILLSLVFIVTSCYSKNTYLKDFAIFVNDVEMSQDSIKEYDWKKMELQFERYQSIEYERFLPELTSNEKAQVERLKDRFNAVKMKRTIREPIDVIKKTFEKILK